MAHACNTRTAGPCFSQGLQLEQGHLLPRGAVGAEAIPWRGAWLFLSLDRRLELLCAAGPRCASPRTRKAELPCHGNLQMQTAERLGMCPGSSFGTATAALRGLLTGMAVALGSLTQSKVSAEIFLLVTLDVPVGPSLMMRAEVDLLCFSRDLSNPAVK